MIYYYIITAILISASLMFVSVKLLTKVYSFIVEKTEARLLSLWLRVLDEMRVARAVVKSVMKGFLGEDSPKTEATELQSPVEDKWKKYEEPTCLRKGILVY